MKPEHVRFVYQVRLALDRQLGALPRTTADRLGTARAAALSRRRRNGAAAYTGQQACRWLQRAAVAIPLVTMALGITSIYHREQQAQLAAIAELDAAVLSDDLPLTAYLDEGFHAYLEQRLQ